MRTTIALIALLAALPARAETRRFYDEHNRELGRAEIQGNTTRFYGPTGREVGRDETSLSGTVRHYDSHGKFTGEAR